MSRMINKLIYLGINQPKLVLFLTLTIISLAAIGLKDLYIKSDYRVYFDKSNKSLKDYEALKNT